MRLVWKQTIQKKLTQYKDAIARQRMNLINKFHKEIGVLVEGDVWNMDLPEIEEHNKKKD